MISIDLLRMKPNEVREATKKRGLEAPISRILELDSRRRATISEMDNLRARRNEASKLIGQTKEKPESQLVQEMRKVGARIKQLRVETREVEEEMKLSLLEIPNIPEDDVPVGSSDEDNVVIRTAGNQRNLDFKPLPHWQLGEQLDIIDFERGVKLSGSRFYVLKGQGARLQRALISWMLDLHTEEHGYKELYLPNLVTRDTAIGSGQLPKFAEAMYQDATDDLWMIPTAEVPMANLHGGEILNPGSLPLNYVSHTPCFRREKAAAGRDTRGIKRGHQFEKVEMFKFVEPADSAKELDRLLADAESVCIRLGIAHRVVMLCTGDLSIASAKTFDLELWAPGTDEWLEVSSCSNCTDFQARRANIRYRPEAKAKPRYVHTLNGSGLGIPRVMIAILENYQRADGSVEVPKVLQPYTGFERIG